MSQFIDNKNRPWNLDLNGPILEKVLAATCRRSGCIHDPHSDEGCGGVYLADLHGKAMNRLGDDPMLQVRVLTVMVTPQLQTANVSATDFGEACVGEALGAATDAMLECIAAFFHGRRRELVQAMANKSKRVVDLGIAKAMEKINDPSFENRLMDAMDRRMERALQSAITSSDFATDSPGSSE